MFSKELETLLWKDPSHKIIAISCCIESILFYGMRYSCSVCDQ